MDLAVQPPSPATVIAGAPPRGCTRALVLDPESPPAECDGALNITRPFVHLIAHSLVTRRANKPTFCLTPITAAASRNNDASSQDWFVPANLGPVMSRVMRPHIPLHSLSAVKRRRMTALGYRLLSLHTPRSFFIAWTPSLSQTARAVLVYITETCVWLS
jgi:hypothetical protein